MFSHSPEYQARLKRPYAPPTVSLKQIHDAVPKHLLQPDPIRSSFYVARDICIWFMLYKFATCISPWEATNFGGLVSPGWQASLIKIVLWCTYFWFQSLVMAGMFSLGHDAGHGTLYSSNTMNNIVGFTIHTFIFIPYFSWRSTHNGHHKATASIERDETYVPYTRGHYKLPDERKAKRADYAEIFEETPLFTLARMLIMQLVGWWMYLSLNTMGAAMYPPGTNHFQPSSPLFKQHQRRSVILSNIGLGTMASVLVYLGRDWFLKYYLVPYLLTNHWIVMFTYLQHSDPTIPHYRKEAWSFIRGAIATVDRPLLGWMGRFFLHNVAHDHIAHHFFVGAPFYNGPHITNAIKDVLKEDYNYDSTNSWYALYRSFTECVFIEEEGGIVFYKNKYGKAARDIQAEEPEVVDKSEPRTGI